MRRFWGWGGEGVGGVLAQERVVSTIGVVFFFFSVADNSLVRKHLRDRVRRFVSYL